MNRYLLLRKVLVVLPFYLFTFLPLSARPQLARLDIQVVLQPNGDARITETRQMEIDSEGTECYIPIGNLMGSEVCDLQVTDEHGAPYENVGEWDVDRSRSWKQNRCGIVTKSNGYELCWGLGESGSRTYVTSYTVTQLVKGYDDFDGFNFMFVSQGMKPSPDHVLLTISMADNTQLTTDNTQIWAFRYQGEVNLINGHIVAETTEPFSSESAMIVMAAFQKDLFQPTHQVGGSIDDLKNRAFEGSDYGEDDEDFVDLLLGAIFLIGFLLVSIIPVIVTIYKMYCIWKARRQINRDLLWYRDIPYDGNLLHANAILNAYKYVDSNYSNLLSAMLLRLIHQGALKVELTESIRGRRAALVIGEVDESQNSNDNPGKKDEKRLENGMMRIFTAAAGNDRILQPKELEQYMKKNAENLQWFVNLLHTKVSFKQAERERSSVVKLYGLRKFLNDFTLANERHLQEVSLWKDYLIYATLFGNANQVLKDMKAINPEYLKMDQLAEVMQQTTIIPTFTRATVNGTSLVQQHFAEKAAKAARASGRGGHSSWGGGGGFSGGGFGGGVR